MKKLILVFAVLLFGVVFILPSAEASVVKTKTGLSYEVVKVGAGAVVAAKGKPVEVHYTGWLYTGGKKGTQFDSSHGRGKPYAFVLGMGNVIKGWDEGVAGMKVGEKRVLMIPSKLGYGARGFPPVIPPNADLIFDVELMSVK